MYLCTSEDTVPGVTEDGFLERARELAPNFAFNGYKPEARRDQDGVLEIVLEAETIGRKELLYAAKLFALVALSLGPGFLEWVDGAFDVPFDSTLDLTVADFDGNGVYDVVTVQGEYPPFRNVYHRNTGPADGHPPVVLATSDTPTTVPVSSLGDGWPRRAVLQDHVMDDGVTFLEADLVWTTDKGGETGGGSATMDHVGGSVFRGVAAPAPSATAAVNNHTVS